MRIEKKAMVALLLAACLNWSWCGSAQDTDREHVKQTTWRIMLQLDAPNLVPPAVQWTVLDEDPIPGFEARVRSMQAYYRRQVEQAQDKAGKEMARSAQKEVSWDLGFKGVTGDKVYLLTWAPQTSHSFGSNGPDGKKWLTTKTVQIKGKPVCWCIPVTVKTGSVVQVTLTEDNVFELNSAFDKAMGQPIKDE